MKIGLDANVLGIRWSGIKHYVYYLLNGLMKTDPDNSYVLFSRREFFEPIELAPNFRQCLATSKWHWRFGLASEIKSNGIEVFHSGDPAPPTARGARFVVTVHDLCYKANRDWVPLSAYLRITLYLGMAIRKSHRIIAISESTKREIVRFYGVPADKIRVVYYGIDHDRFKPIADRALLDGIKQKYNTGDRFILYTGIINVRKNITRLVEAFGRLKKDGNLPYKLVLAGEEAGVHPDVPALSRQLGIENDVLRIGFVPQNELPVLYNAAEFLAYPSLYEGFGLPILEAMACGTPVLTATPSSMPEVVGDTGLVVDPYDTGAIVQAMRSFRDNPDLRRRCSEEGKKRSALFNWEKAARQTLEVYREAAKS